MATLDAEGRPHLVPVTFAMLGDDRLVTAVDHKQKRTRRLRRLENIEREPRVTVLADHYEDDWSALWWVRIDGTATVSDLPPAGAVEALTAKYRHYRGHTPEGPWITIFVDRVSSWEA